MNAATRSRRVGCAAEAWAVGGQAEFAADLGQRCPLDAVLIEDARRGLEHRFALAQEALRLGGLSCERIEPIVHRDILREPGKPIGWPGLLAAQAGCR